MKITTVAPGTYELAAKFLETNNIKKLAPEEMGIVLKSISFCIEYLLPPFIRQEVDFTGLLNGISGQDDQAMDIYTMNQWKADRTFSASPGQEIEEAVYTEMFNCMPPLQLSREAVKMTDIPVHAGFMMGEPHSCDQEGQLFLAFGMNDYGNKKRYFFLGLAHKDRKLNGSYYHFDCMNAFVNDGLFPCSEFADDAEAIQKAADYEATLEQLEYKDGELVSTKVIYQPKYL